MTILTRREVEVLRLMAARLHQSANRDELVISAGTVKSHGNGCCGS